MFVCTHEGHVTCYSMDSTCFILNMCNCTDMPLVLKRTIPDNSGNENKL